MDKTNFFFKYLKRYIFVLSLFAALFRGEKTYAQADSIVAYVFLSETCPICQNQTLSLRDLDKQFKQKGVRFVGIFPNIEVTNEENIAKFKQKYKLDFELLLDPQQTLTKNLGATITPQVFVVNTKNNKVLYEGKIDNSFERVGKRRQIITAFYLRDALLQITQNQCITLNKTEAVGCFIIKSN